MSVAVGTVSTSKDNSILSLTMKAEEQKHTKLEKLCSKAKENADIFKDLRKEISRKMGDKEDVTQLDSENDEFFDAVTIDDESSSEQMPQKLGNILSSVIEDYKKPEVQILSLSVLSPGRPDVVLSVPFPATTSKTTLFTLKEGSKYRIKFNFTVSKKTVNNLKYTYMVWKSGVRVNTTKMMVGTFNPRQEPHVFELEEGTTPSGFFARGPFLVRSKFVDDDGNCFLDTTYYFDIRKDWGARDKH